MAIPNAREAPPPPLPPPRYIGGLETGDDPGWKYGNSRHDANGKSRYASVKPGSSLLGGGQPNKEYSNSHIDQYDRRDSRRGSAMSTMTSIDPVMVGADGLDHSDDDRNSSTRPSLSSFRYIETLALNKCCCACSVLKFVISLTILFATLGFKAKINWAKKHFIHLHKRTTSSYSLK
jgi:hypothetical protein